MTVSHIGKYRIDGVLGQGAMGIVYRGFDAAVGRVVAIKTVRKELLEGRQPWNAVARFRSEARAAGRLSHPNIVTIYEFSEDEQSAHLVCEYVAGLGLDQWLARHGRADLPTALLWMDQLLDALECAHAHGVVHRDVKAANLLVVSRRLVKLADFGIAHVDSADRTQVGLMVGTPCCMAPEQIQGGHIDRRTDVFAAGVLLYELLTGQRPFGGGSEAVLQQILSSVPAAPSSLRDGLPAAIDAVVLRALAKKPEQRYPSAADFRAGLQQALRGADADDDATRLITPAAPRAAAMPASWDLPTERSLDPSTLERVETSLRSHVGPIAGMLVRKLSRSTSTLDDLLAQLARNIPGDAERQRFVETLRGSMNRDQPSAGSAAEPSRPPSAVATPQASAAALDPARLAEIQALLAQRIGPMASVAVRRATRDAPNAAELCRRVALNVPDAQARRSFLAECGIDPSGITT